MLRYNTYKQLKYLRQNLYTFARSKYRGKASNDFQQMQQQATQDYFQQYRKKVENESVIKDFRRQVFDRKNQPIGQSQIDMSLDQQQNRLNQLLKTGTKQQINKKSTKIMQHLLNNRKMFKGSDSKDIFKDYGDYTTYKTNYVKIQNRNYEDMDNIEFPQRAANNYGFLDTVSNDYIEKQQAKNTMKQVFPGKYQDMTLKDFGKHIDYTLGKNARKNMHEQQYNNMLTGQQAKISFDGLEHPVYDSKQETLDVVTGARGQTGTLSTQTINKIYDLYLQGWSIRDISKRFGILPIRAKFHIWTRAKLYNELVPRYGLKGFLAGMGRQIQYVQKIGEMDYGLDIAQMQQQAQYQSIRSWTKQRVDAQRKPQQYTAALRKLQKRHKFDKYDIVQVGTHGKQNKMYLLREWKFHRGKNSDEYILKNRTLRPFMWQKRNSQKVYY